MKVVTTARSLTPRQKLVRDTELKIQRLYGLGDTLTLRQRISITRSILETMLLLYDRLPAANHGGGLLKTAFAEVENRTVFEGGVVPK